MSPWSFTLRELLDMAEARMRDEWARTNAVQATIANVHGNKLTPEDFSPFKQIDQRGEGLQKFRAMVKTLAKAGKIRTVKKESK